MGNLRQAVLILGEGPTEFFYFKSLCDVFKRLTVKPDYPKHTDIKELEAKIAEGVDMGKSKGLHSYFERNGGSLSCAVTNANRSMEEKKKSGREYTYSELGRLIKLLEELSNQ